jgi:cysteinyl-tRNA synthetase
VGLKLYNTMTRRKQDFTPLEEGKVSIYTCGPTIYAPPQIGNWRAFVFYDVLVRYLSRSGFEVTHVMNLTDVDDKTIRASRAAKVPLRQFTDGMAEDFFRDLDALNCRRATEYPRATENIPQMVKIISKLAEKGHTYQSGGSTYFRVNSFAGYGKLSGFDVNELKPGARIDSDAYEKEGAADFALWKGWTEGDGDVFWETEFGKGRPGWHIECSAMSMDRLGETIDIHGGGSDLVFPHHENEVAQSEAATGKPFVRFWLHNGWLLSDGKKMSKSLHNYYVLSDVEARNFSALDLRYFYLTTHYRQQFNFTWEGIEAAASARSRIADFVRRLSEAGESASAPSVEALLVTASKGLEDAMEDDLNTAEALGSLHAFIGEVNRLGGPETLDLASAGRIRDLVSAFDEVLGILPGEEEPIPEEVTKLAQERQEARRSREFGRADEIRHLLESMGYTVEDTPRGPRVKKI